MIYEGVVTTANTDGSAHVTPLGFVRTEDTATLSPFVPSRTLDNLRRTAAATMNLTDDVRVIAGCLTGRRDWRTLATDAGSGWRLADCLAHLELQVVDCHDHPERPSFTCSIVAEQSHRPFRGFNRAQAAVVEAAILVSRLDWLDRVKVAREMAYLTIAIEKTAGDREHTAWAWLVSAIEAHPRHGPLTESST